MRAKEAALRVLQRNPAVPEPATNRATTVRQEGTTAAPITATTVRQCPLPVDYEFAELYGLDRSRQEFFGAVALVADFDGERWPEDKALENLRQWWGRDLETLTAAEWIVSAAHADEVRAIARDEGCR